MSKDTNKNGISWEGFQKEVAFAMKNYIFIKVTKKQAITVKSMWRKGLSISDAVSYIILSAK